MGIEYYKYHALGNDYIVIDPEKFKLELSKKTIQTICHRNFGIGSDGILYGPILESGRMRLRIFNPDGSEAEKSGNGIRIFSRYLVDQQYVKDRSFELETLGGQVQVEILDPKAGHVKVDMGVATFRSEWVPVKGKSREVINETLEIGGKSFAVTCVSVGNPHCVIPLKDISKERALELGPQVENHSMFPNRINMQLLRVLDRRNIQIEIWERGAGYTLASGSSSCAAASAAHRLGLVDKDVAVHMPGGVIEIGIRQDGHVSMTGPVSFVAQGEFAPEFRRELDQTS